MVIKTINKIKQWILSKKRICNNCINFVSFDSVIGMCDIEDNRLGCNIKYNQEHSCNYFKKAKKGDKK